MQELEVYSMIGAEGFTRLVAAFYRQVPQDNLLGPMYPAQDLSGAEQRLRDFLIGRFGGPHSYIEQRGHPRLRARHSPFHINQAARDRWMRLMNSAFREAALPEEAERVLRKFLDEISTFMIKQAEHWNALAQRTTTPCSPFMSLNSGRSKGLSNLDRYCRDISSIIVFSGLARFERWAAPA